MAAAGHYTVSFRLSSPYGINEALHLADSSGADLTGAVAVPNTGGYETWTTVTADVTLPAGNQTLTVDRDTNGWNFHSMAFAQGGDGDAWKLKPAESLRLDHNIMLVPIDMFDEDLLGRHLQHHHPVVTVCPDELLDEARQRASALGFVLPATPYSPLSDATLTAQWNAIHEHFIPDLAALTGEMSLTRRLDLAPFTPLHRRLARQIGWPAAERVPSRR